MNYANKIIKSIKIKKSRDKMVDEIKSYEEAGKIVSKVRSDASKMIQNGLPIIDLVEYVESEILKAGAGSYFLYNFPII